MKIVVNTENNELLNTFIKFSKENNHELINAKTDDILFENIENGSVEAFVLANDSLFYKKAVDFIKKNNPYIPVIAITSHGVVQMNIAADMYMNLYMPFETFVKTIFYNLNSYKKTFSTLQRLTAKMQDKIEFATCVYDPTKRILYHKNQEVKKLSIKEGGILEILASNYGEVVKREVILERVWRKTDYFVSRSMDVYLSYLRNIFRDNEIKLTIKNISGVGLILE